MQVSELRQRLHAAGAGPGHAYRVLRLWSNALPQSTGKRKPEHFLPSSLLAALPSIEQDLAGLARLRSAHPSARSCSSIATRSGRPRPGTGYLPGPRRG